MRKVEKKTTKTTIFYSRAKKKKNSRWYYHSEYEWKEKTDFEKYGNEQNKTHKKPIFITFQFDEKNFIRLLNQ